MDLPDIVNELIEKQYQSTTSSSTDNSSMLNTSINDNMTLGSERQDDDVLLFLMLYLMNGRRRHHVENCLQIVDSLIDTKFKEYFRLSRHTVIILIDELETSALHTFDRKSNSKI